MDLRIFAGGFIICLQTIASLTSAQSGYNCRMCKPGFYASRMCSSDHDTVCKPCSFRTFSSEANVLTNCQPCSNCHHGEFVVEECSKSSDTKCATCDSVKDNYSQHFLRECLQADQAQPLLLNISDSNGITLQENTKDSIDLFESSSSPDGSGVDSSEGVNIPIFPFVNVSSDEDYEGSGEVPVIDDSSRNDTNATKLVPVILPDDDTESDKITDSTTVNTTESTTTVREGIIIPIGGIDVDEAPEGAQPEDVDVDDVNVYVHTGASQTQKEREDGGGASVGVVVTVGLVTAFVFFVLGFLASRVWNGRRDRTFNVLEAERRNGKPPVECSGIEYKGSGNNVSKPGSAYKGLPANAKANGSGTDPKSAKANPKPASLPPIYKPIQRSKEQPTASQPKQTAPVPTTDSKPERPVSEIKYIDEVSDDEQETDKLLPPPSPGTDAGGDSPGLDAGEDSPGTDNADGAAPTTPAAPSAGADRTEAEVDTSNENTPMLPKEPSTGDS